MEPGKKNKAGAVRVMLLVGLTAVGVVLFQGVVRELLSLALNQSLYSHTLLIPVISAYILWVNRKRNFSRLGFSAVEGVPLLLLGVGLLLLGGSLKDVLSQSDRLFFTTLGLVSWILGGFVWGFGFSALKSALFPMFFLLFMVPVPSVVMGPIVSFLQVGSAYAARVVLTALGVPVYFEGMLISLPGVTVEVAEQCSGVRSAIALMILSVVAAYMFLDTPWRRVLLVLAVIPVTIFKNGLRVVTLAMLGAYVDISYLTDSIVHSRGGKPFFVVAVLLMLPVLWGLRRRERKETAARAMIGAGQPLKGGAEPVLR